MSLNNINLQPFRVELDRPFTTEEVDLKWQKLQISINQIIAALNAADDSEVSVVSSTVNTSGGVLNVPTGHVVFSPASFKNFGKLQLSNNAVMNISGMMSNAGLIINQGLLISK